MENRKLNQAAIKRTTISANHASREFLHKLNELRWSKSLVDVAVVGEEDAGENDIVAHKLLLCGCSPYFNTLFSSPWAADTGGEEPGALERHKLAGVSTASLKSLVDFMYHGEIEITEDNAADILVAADLLLMERLKDAICKFMQTIICAANCVYFSKLADFYSCRELQQSAKRFMKRNFEDVCRTEDFLQLSVEDVEELIASDNISVESEETVVDAIKLWCNNETRREHRARLMAHVKLSNLSSDSLDSLVQHNLISSSLSVEREVTVEKSRSRGLNKFIVVMAFDSQAVEYLDLDREEEGWNVLTECPNMRYGLSGAGLVSQGDTLLVTGGVGRKGILKAIPRFTTFNVRTNVWSEGPPMLEARKCHGTAVLEGKLYVLGGSDQQMSVLSAECLDLTQPEDQWQWRPLTPLPSWHNGNYCPVLHNTLYLPVAYGTDTDKTFCPERDLWQGWTGESQQRENRDRPGVGVLGEHIYLVGGASTRQLLDLVERWDGTNWTRLAPLQVAREGPGVVGHAGLLYVIGGRGSGGTVERYSPDTDTWTLMDIKVACPDQEYSAVILDRIV